MKAMTDAAPCQCLEMQLDPTNILEVKRSSHAGQASWDWRDPECSWKDARFIDRAIGFEIQYAPHDALQHPLQAQGVSTHGIKAVYSMTGTCILPIPFLFLYFSRFCVHWPMTAPGFWLATRLSTSSKCPVQQKKGN
jgi:hypothetical protein